MFNFNSHTLGQRSKQTVRAQLWPRVGNQCSRPSFTPNTIYFTCQCKCLLILLKWETIRVWVHECRGHGRHTHTPTHSDRGCSQHWFMWMWPLRDTAWCCKGFPPVLANISVCLCVRTQLCVLQWVSVCVLLSLNENQLWRTLWLSGVDWACKVQPHSERK